VISWFQALCCFQNGSTCDRYALVSQLNAFVNKKKAAAVAVAERAEAAAEAGVGGGVYNLNPVDP
jgi:hypothetical protein